MSSSFKFLTYIKFSNVQPNNKQQPTCQVIKYASSLSNSLVQKEFQ